MLTKDCKQCGAIITKKASHSMLAWTDRVKYCSKECSKKNTYFGRVGWEPWSKSQKGVHLSPESEFKKGQTMGVNNINWKGDEVGYFSLHNWMGRAYGRPSLCEDCGLTDPTRKYQWANISHKYLRDRLDWKRLCIPCHRKMDMEDGYLLRGDSHPMAKLNAKKVKLIRLMAKEFNWSRIRLITFFGPLYGISRYTLGDILREKTWKHV